MELGLPNSNVALNEQKTVLTIKYKVYIAILIIIMALSRGYMNESVITHNAVRANITALESQKMIKDAEYNQVIKDLTTLKDISNQKSTLIGCLSTRGCTSIPESLKPVLAPTRAFLQLQKNDGQKMEFDQKKILANINEYLLKLSNGQPNGLVTSIVFGAVAPVVGSETLVQIPITMTVDFADKNGLLSFVYNVENMISAQFPMLYRLTSVNYDIVKYEQNQTVTIELVGYMMK